MQLEDRLQRQIIVADTIMYQAILSFVNQDLASYVKGEFMVCRELLIKIIWFTWFNYPAFFRKLLSHGLLKDKHISIRYIVKYTSLFSTENGRERQVTFQTRGRINIKSKELCKR